MDVAAVGADPHVLAVAGKDLALLQVLEQLVVALLVLLFDLADRLEQVGDAGEALLAGDLGELGVHLGPLIALAGGGVLEVLGRSGHGAVVQELKPDLGVLLLIAGGLLEELGDLDIALLAGCGGVVGVLVAGLGFAGERGEQVGLCAGTLEIFHVRLLLFDAD